MSIIPLLMKVPCRFFAPGNRGLFFVVSLMVIVFICHKKANRNIFNVGAIDIGILD